jgi:hypothetical protein
MSQNLKIILANVDKQTPNNVGFSDTITIKGDSKIALTSFNASFDINKLGQDILGQSFTMNLNKTLYDSPRVVTIPDATYYHETDLHIEMLKQLNKVFSAYEKDAPANQKRVFTGYNVNFTNGNVVADETGIGFSMTKDKMAITLHVTPLAKLDLGLTVDSDFSINDDGELTTTNEEIDFVHTYDASKLPGAGLPTDTFLMKGGGVAVQYNVRFNLKNVTLTSNFKMTDQNGDYMSLNYDTVNRPTGTAPTVNFYVEKSVSGVITKDYIGNYFYNYVSLINDNSERPLAGPWTLGQTNAVKDSRFIWCVRDGKWIIVYFDANDSTYHEVYTNGTYYKIQDNYTFTKSIQQPNTNQVVYYPDATQATLRITTPTVGSTTLKTTFNFENASRLREIYSFGVVGQMQPENTLPAQYTPNGETDFYPKQNFEMACEIDTIKIKNYVGTKGNTGAGRKNIIAYFTPETAISQSSFIYRFDPSNPIYLAVDSKKDIDFNSLNIRFINTYSNKTFSADTITCVLTNAP